MTRCRHCSRLIDDEESHECDGDNVSIVVAHPSVADKDGVNPALAFESREEADDHRDRVSHPTRIVEAALIEEGEGGEA